MANTTNYNWETPDDTDLVKDGAAAIRTLGSSVDTTTKALNPSTTLGDIEYRSSTANTNTRLGIGSTGQVLTVAGGVPTWATSDDANAIQNAIVDAKGDLIAASAADTPARLAVGANGTALVADSTQATGLKWASVSSNLDLDTIASGSLPAAAELSLTGLTQDFLFLRLSGVQWDTSADGIILRFNSDTGSNYSYVQYEVNAANFANSFDTAATSFKLITSNARNSTNTSFSIVIQNAKAAGFHNINSVGRFKLSSTDADMGTSMQGYYTSATAITSIQLSTTSGYSFSSGTYTLIGA